MKNPSGAGWALGAATVALAVVAGVALVGGGAATSASSAATVHGSPANLTINPVNDVDHQPGEPNASYQIFATGEDAVEQDIDRLNYALIRYPAGDISSCTAFSTAVFGVDRGNDDPGTKTDESLVNNQKESGHTTHEIYVEFYDESDLGGIRPISTVTTRSSPTTRTATRTRRSRAGTSSPGRSTGRPLTAARSQ